MQIQLNQATTLTLTEPLEDLSIEDFKQQLTQAEKIVIQTGDLKGEWIQLLLCAAQHKSIKIDPSCEVLNKIFESIRWR